MMLPLQIGMNSLQLRVLFLHGKIAVINILDPSSHSIKLKLYVYNRQQHTFFPIDQSHSIRKKTATFTADEKLSNDENSGTKWSPISEFTCERGTVNTF